MSVSRAYTLYAASINTTLIDQIDQSDFDSGLEHFLLNVDGGVDPVFQATKTLQPKISLSTNAIASALALCSMDGLALTAGDFYFQKLANGSAPRVSGSAHVKLAATAGVVLPRRLQAGHVTPATLALEVFCLSNAGNAPLVASKNSALAGTPTADECFVAGPVSINGTELVGVQSIDIDFGINEELLGGDGEAYNSFAAIMTRQPKITIECFDMDLAADFGIGGTAQGATDTVIYFRKVSANGLRVANVTEEHISVTIDAGHIGVKSGSARPGEPAMITLELTPTFDGTNAILAIDTTAAIA